VYLQDETQIMYALILPTPALKNEFLEMVADFEAANEDCFADTARAISSDFDAYLHKLRQHENGLGLKPGYVPQTTYWFVNDDRQVLGVLRIRHWLTPRLERFGGHIGFEVRPSERRKGHATLMLAFGVERARELGLQRVLLTCAADNLASARVIEKNGGIFEDQIQQPDRDTPIRRYWIDLSKN
jgi:predicted acetyltransferase